MNIIVLVRGQAVFDWLDVEKWAWLLFSDVLCSVEKFST